MSGDVSATTNADAGTPTTSSGASRFGWMLGAGAERMLSRQWSVKAEYDYLQFGGRRIGLRRRLLPARAERGSHDFGARGVDRYESSHWMRTSSRSGSTIGSATADRRRSMPSRGAARRPSPARRSRSAPAMSTDGDASRRTSAFQGEGLSSLASRLTYSRHEHHWRRAVRACRPAKRFGRQGLHRLGQRRRPAQRRGLGRSVRDLRPLFQHLVEGR